MALRNKSHFTLPMNHIFEVYTNGDEIVISVRPKLDIRVPLYFFSTLRIFKIQLAVMKFNVWSQHRFC